MVLLPVYFLGHITLNLILQESGEPVGTVVNIFNTGANDLLHVKLSSSRKIPGQIGKTGEGHFGPLVWVPFVEAIVPTVDLEKREMLITPPKGLLELNIRSDMRSKKERRELVRYTPFLLFHVLVPKVCRIFLLDFLCLE